MADWLRLFEDVAWEIHGKVRPLFGSEESRRTVGRGAGGDVTMMVDVLAEEIAVKALEDRGVSCVLVSEECGERKIGEEDKSYVVLDGIDGTTNAIRGLSLVSTSLAFADGPYLRDVRVGLVMDFSRDTIFYAKRGEGAFQDKTRLKPSSVTSLREALVSFELDYPKDKGKQIQNLTPLLANARKIRHLGSTALEVCYVASGSLDAFVDVRNVARATDLAAAFLILEEAGGLSVTPEGKRLGMELRPTSTTSLIAAANPPLCRNILKLLNYRPECPKGRGDCTKPLFNIRNCIRTNHVFLDRGG